MFDRNAIKDNFSRAAASYDAHANLQKIVRADALEMAREYFPQGLLVVDIGCGTAAIAGENWQVVGVDIAYGMCKLARENGANIINAAADALPLADASVDGVFSSLMLQWIGKPEAVISEIMRVLKPDSVAIISTFVQGTLQELKDAFSALGDAQHISEFMSSEQLLLRVAHSGARVLEVRDETYAQEIESAYSLMKSIKNIGASNKLSARKKGLMTGAQLAKVAAAYQGNIASWQVLTMVIEKA